MNGRALNEKAVEISPSSHRVLDRAQEIVSMPAYRPEQANIFYS